MGQGASPEDIQQLTRYSAVHGLVCLPFVALGGFGIIPPWVFAAASVPLGAIVGLVTLSPRRAGIIAGIAGMAVAGVVSGALSTAGVVFDPRGFQDPRWTVGLAAGALIGCLVGMYVWDVLRETQPPANEAKGGVGDGVSI